MSQEKDEYQTQVDNNKSKKKPWPLWLQGGRIGLIISILIAIIRPTNQHVIEILLFICKPALYLISFIPNSDIAFNLSGLALFISYFLAGALIGMLIQIGRNHIKM